MEEETTNHGHDTKSVDRGVGGREGFVGDVTLLVQSQQESQVRGQVWTERGREGKMNRRNSKMEKKKTGKE